MTIPPLSSTGTYNSRRAPASASFKATRERQVPTARGRFLCFSFHYIMTASSRFLTCRCFPYKRTLYSIRACARVSGKDTQESDL